jgi:hypothetical protein
VANDEHLDLLRQGSAIWNEWRSRTKSVKPDLTQSDLRAVDLRGADLGDADLNRSNLSHATLDWTNLTFANLASTNLSRASLMGANLTGANLSGANLSNAWLFGANFTRALLARADLSRASFSLTIFGGVDLGETTGLDDCNHFQGSVIDYDTLSQSGTLPLSFLRGCGLPDYVIGQLPSLGREASPFYSCFISYSTKDQMFAKRLYAELQNKGVRCWFAPHDLPTGAKTWDTIDEEIRLRDKLLVILSKASIGSDWVEDEVNKAYAQERSRRKIVLLPIRIDNLARTTAEPWAVKLRDQRNIGDFRQWKKPEKYQKALERLLCDLKMPATK